MSTSPRRPSGKLSQAGSADLEGRLGEPLQRPAIDCSRTGIPRPYHKAPGGIVPCPCGRFGAIAPILIKDLVVDRRRVDAAGRAVAYQAVEPVPYAVVQPVTRTSPTRPIDVRPRCGTSCSLPNQRSAARTLDLWLAKVLAVTPTRA